MRRAGGPGASVGRETVRDPQEDAVSTSHRPGAVSRGGLRHPVELPFFVFMVVLNLVIIAVIVQAARTLPLLPERLHGSGWAVTVRSALIGLLLLIPGLIIVRETQRASVRGSAV